MVMGRSYRLRFQNSNSYTDSKGTLLACGFIDHEYRYILKARLNLTLCKIGAMSDNTFCQQGGIVLQFQFNKYHKAM